MTRPDDLDRQLESWLDACSTVPVPAGMHERVLEPTTRRRPRPAVLARVGSHWISGVPASRQPALRWAGATVVALVIILILGAAIIVAGRPRPEPPSGVPLVYTSDGDIVVAGGTDPVVIADGAPSSDRSGTWYSMAAGWAPDGSHLVYHEVRPGQVPSVITQISDATGRRVGSFLIDGSAVGRESIDRQLKSNWQTWWSPDSTLLATLPWTAQSIRIFGLDGMLRYDLPLPDGYLMWRELGLTWAPDGQSVLVAITSGGGELSDRQVWQVPIDGSAPRRLPDDHPLASWDLRATHDGRRIAFSGLNGPFPDGSIFVANGDGSDPHPVTRNDALAGTASFPMWSPDDTMIAYMITQDDGGLRAELRVVDLTTGADRRVVTAREDGSVNRGWSSDGDWLLFRAYWVEPDIDNLQDKTALWSVRPDGTDLQVLVEDVDFFDPRP